MTTRTIVRNVLANWASYAFNILVTFVMTPIMVRYLGKDGYGIWLLINSLAGYLGLLDLGLQSSTTKYVAEYVAKEDEESLAKLIGTTFHVFAGIAAGIALLSIVLSGFTNHIFKIPPAYRDSAPLLLIIAGCQVSVLFLFAVFSQVISGKQRYDLNSVSAMATLLLRSVLIYLFLKQGYGLLAVAWICFGCTLFGKVLSVLIVLGLRVRLSLGFRHFDRDMLRRIFHYGKISFTIMVATRVIYYTDNLVIGTLLSVSGVAVFGIAASLVNYTRALVMSATNVLNPAASHMGAVDARALRPLGLHASRYTSYVVAPVVFGFFVLGGAFIDLWLGEGFEETPLLLAVLAVAQLVSLPLYGIGSMLYGIAKHGILARAAVVEAVLNLALSVLLAKPLGLVGVALGTVLPSVFLNLFYLPWKTTRFFGVTVAEYFANAFGKPVALAGVAAAVMLVGKEYIGCGRWTELALCALLSAAAYAIVVYLFDLRPLWAVRGERTRVGFPGPAEGEDRA